MTRDDLARRLDQALLGVVAIMLAAANLSIAVSQIALGLALGLLLLRWWPGGRAPRRTGLGRWVMLLAVWAALMIPHSGDPEQSLLFYRRFYLFTALVTVATVARGETRRRWLLAALLAGAAVASVWGQAQVLQSTGALFGRRLGQMSNPMTSGCLLMLTLLVAGGVLLAPGQARRLRWAVALAALPVLAGLAGTITRAAWLGLAAGAAAMLLTRPRWLAGAGALAAAAALAVVLSDGAVLPERVRARLDNATPSVQDSNTRRLGMWRAGARMVAAHPVTGVGDRDLTAIVPAYTDPGETKFHGHLHSNPVMLAAIWGVPGLLLASGLLGWQGWLLLRAWRRRPPPGRAPLATGWVLGALGAWVGFAVAGLFEWYFGDAESMLLFLAITGAALGAAQSVEETADA